MCECISEMKKRERGIQTFIMKILALIGFVGAKSVSSLIPCPAKNTLSRCQNLKIDESSTRKVRRGQRQLFALKLLGLSLYLYRDKIINPFRGMKRSSIKTSKMSRIVLDSKIQPEFSFVSEGPSVDKFCSQRVLPDQKVLKSTEEPQVQTFLVSRGNYGSI